MNILVINAGSSSLKYQLFDTDSHEVLAKGLCERIGIGGRVKHSGKREHVEDVPLADHADAIRKVTELLVHKDIGVIADMSEIGAVGHRVVHGGELFNKSVLIDDKVFAAIEECVPLAPLHNPPNLTGISACRRVMGDVPQVAVFDTAFHQTIPKKAYLYALPYELYEKLKIRRYGFHGTSHRYVAQRAAVLLGRPFEKVKIITCHLGNGSSVSAVDCGASVETSMGFTPLEGVPMGTRSGTIDPAIIEFLIKKENISIEAVTDILNKKSGVLGVSGVSSDFRDLHDAADAGNERAQIALDMFAHSIKKYIGAYAAVMGGCDALVFTAGIGENNPLMRQWVASGLDYMGLKFDLAKNNVRHEADISADDSPNRIFVIPTNEELVIALDTENIVEKM